MNLKEESFVDILYRTENFGRNVRFHKLRSYDGLADVENEKDLCNKLGHIRAYDSIINVSLRDNVGKIKNLRRVTKP